jgi:hypothetical protein
VPLIITIIIIIAIIGIVTIFVIIINVFIVARHDEKTLRSPAS